ncbi:MAG: hypothetical protein V1702_04000 [Candidatus Woesearchaeota archaeon]
MAMQNLGYSNEDIASGARQLIGGIMQYVRTDALNPSFHMNRKLPYGTVDRRVRASSNLKGTTPGIFTPDNATLGYDLGEKVREIAAEHDHKKIRFDSKSISEAAKQTREKFETAFETKAVKPLTALAAATGHINSERFFRGLTYDQAVAKAKGELQSIKSNGGTYEISVSPKGLYETLSGMAQVLYHSESLETGSGKPSALVTALDKILDEQNGLQAFDNIAVTLPEEEAAAVIAAQHGRLRDVVARKTAKKAAAATQPKSTTVIVGVTVQQP